MITPDFIFSYWTILWVILYSMNWTIYSPVPSLFFEIIVNLFQLAFFIYKRVNTETILVFIFVIFLMKGIPLYILRNRLHFGTRDILAFVIVFSVYLAWLCIRETNVYSLYQSVNKSIIEGSNETPIIRLYHTMKNITAKTIL